MVQDAKPVVWLKWKNKDPSCTPFQRSGHSMSQFNDKFFCFGGTVNGLEDPNVKKIGPCNEMWLLEVFQKQMYAWTKLSCKGDIPCPRSNHTATTIKHDNRDDYIFIFGGMGEKGKLDDCYKFGTSELTFTMNAKVPLLHLEVTTPPAITMEKSMSSEETEEEDMKTVYLKTFGSST